MCRTLRLLASRFRAGLSGENFAAGLREEIGPVISSWPGLARLDPAIYVFLGFGDLGGQDLDARNKSGQGPLTVVLWLAPLDPTLSQLLNRTAVGLARPSTPSSARNKDVDARIKSAQDDFGCCLRNPQELGS
jgi:hypothetical protein